MRSERGDVDNRPDRQREQQMEPDRGSFNHPSASTSSSRLGTPTRS
jgi:hypothetical protein